MSSIFDLVKKKGQLPPTTRPGPSEASASASATTYTYASGQKKAVDPVVARLKEKRRLEREKMEAELREKKGLKAKARPTAPKTTGGGQPKKATKAGVKSGSSPAPSVPARPPAKKMKFNELMKKASTIDQSKLSISIGTKSKSRSPETRPANTHNVRSDKADDARGPGKAAARDVGRPRPTDAARGVPGRGERPRARRPLQEAALQRNPLPTRGPSPKLAQRLQQKKSSKRPDVYGDDCDDIGSFIASDEEDCAQEPEYDRDEIWAMFNKGRKRAYFERYDDYDSDDMEATGTEILDEELRSKRRAEIEDRKELAEEQRRAELKRQKRLRASGKA